MTWYMDKNMSDVGMNGETDPFGWVKKSKFHLVHINNNHSNISQNILDVQN